MSSQFTECTVNDVGVLITKVTGGHLRLKIPELAIRLGITDYKPFTNCIRDFTMTLTEPTCDIVAHWKNSKSEEAKLSELTAVLRDIGLAQAANELDKKFGPDAIITAGQTETVTQNSSGNTNSYRPMPLPEKSQEDATERDVMIRHGNTEKNILPKIKSIPVKITLVVIVVFVLVLMGIGILWFVNRNFKNDHEKSDAQIPTTEALPNFGDGVESKTLLADPSSTTLNEPTHSTDITTKEIFSDTLNIQVDLFESLQTQIEAAQNFEIVNLNITSTSLSSWHSKTLISQLSKVKSLHAEGTIAPSDLLHLINQMPLLQSVVFSNRNGELCKEVEHLPIMPEFNLSFPNLKSLELKHFDDCDHILEAVVQFKMNQLQSILFSGTVNYNSREQLFEIFRRNNDSLKAIDLSGTYELKESLFDVNSNVVMYNVDKLSLNFKVDVEKSFSVINSQLCETLPGLKEISIGNLNVSFNEFKEILNCKESVWLAASLETDVDLNDISGINYLPRFLEKVYLNIYVTDCSRIVKLDTIKRLDNVWINYIPGGRICQTCYDDEVHQECEFLKKSKGQL